jgi:hypothetical protein
VVLAFSAFAVGAKILFVRVQLLEVLRRSGSLSASADFRACSVGQPCRCLYYFRDGSQLQEFLRFELCFEGKERAQSTDVLVCAKSPIRHEVSKRGGNGKTALPSRIFQEVMTTRSLQRVVLGFESERDEDDYKRANWKE